MNELFKIERVGEGWVFINDSEFDLVISVLAIKPKRKNKDFCLIPRKSFRIYDFESTNEKFDITKVTFTFKNT